MTNISTNPYSLGLDLGSNSIGWALIKLDENENPCGIEKVGVRVFKAGMKGLIEQGKEKSRCKNRREARLSRRQIERRSRRYKKLAGLLQKIGLLPEGDIRNSDERQRIFEDLDNELRKIYIDKNLPEKEKHLINQKFIYYLRSLAVEQELEPYALGRVLYHLGQRRGYLSNRKGQKEDDSEKGKVVKGIAEIRQEMIRLGAETLGRYFAKIDPTKQRIRGRWTARDMYEHEFYAIWNFQSKFYPDIFNKENKRRVFESIFFQRPLKSQKDKIGYCIFENVARGAIRNRRRAPWFILKAQYFRILQNVNNLTVRTNRKDVRSLTQDERRMLIDYLNQHREVTFNNVRKLLNLSDEYKFNFEKNKKGEAKLIGNRTAGSICKIIGDKWDQMTPELKDKLVHDIYSIVDNRHLKKRLIKYWKFTEEEAEKLSNMPIEDGYCNLSRQAIDKLIPGLEEGKSFSTVAKEIYGVNKNTCGDVDLLPPLNEAPISIYNPVVKRVVSEMRKIVNELVKLYGKPRFIRIETARELKKNKKERQAIYESNEKRHNEREKIKEQLRSQGLSNPSEKDVDKYLLAEECGWVCPYTGKAISFRLLFFEPEFDVEHIIPYSRCLDNSMRNKTLCHVAENRSFKNNLTPYEAYGSMEEKYNEILSRVEKFNSQDKDEKLRRFKMNNEELEEFLDNFTSSQLNDTRYAARVAVDYCSLLYGDDWRKHIFTVSGGITHALRTMWKLNNILGNSEKNRIDNRQHAIDAIVIAMVSPRMVRSISEQSSKISVEEKRNKHWWNYIEPPWETLYNEAFDKVTNIIVSRRIDNKVSGRLHEDTLYSFPEKRGENEYVSRVRKPLSSITSNEVDDIVDPVVKELVIKKIEELGGEPNKIFKDPKNLPMLPNKNGDPVPIKKVRIFKKDRFLTIGQNERRRCVTVDENHHMEIFEIKDKKGKIKWDANVVTMFEAYRRRKCGEPIISKILVRDGEVVEDAKFLFSLQKGDIVYMKDSNGKYDYFYVTTICETSEGYKGLELVTHFVSKKDKDYPNISKSVNKLFKEDAKKCVVDVLGCCTLR